MLIHIYGGVRSQGVIKVKPSEFTMPKQASIWLCEGRTLHCWGMQGESFPHHRATQFTSLRFCQEPNLSMAELQGVGRVGVAGQAWKNVGEMTPKPKPHISVFPGFCLENDRVEPPRVKRMGPQDPGEWNYGNLVSFASSSLINGRHQSG